jgi:hypothetical protein
MTRQTLIILVISILIYSACREKPVQHDDHQYFGKGELSDDEWEDSLSNRYYSNELRSLKETSLKDTSNKNETIRLTVPRSMLFSTYCIRLDKVDSMYVVAFKMGPDREAIGSTGLNGLALSYNSDFEKMDSIYENIITRVNQFDIFSQDNSTPEIVIQNKIVGADGLDYVLEYYKDGKHVALTRWDGFLDKKFYKKSDEFMEIVKGMNSLVPPGLLPEYMTAKEIADFRFPVFK